MAGSAKSTKNAQSAKAVSSTLKLRIISGVVIIAVTLGFVVWGRWPFAVFVALMGAGAAYEWTRMVLEENRARVFELSAVLMFASIVLAVHLSFFTYALVFALGFGMVLRMHAKFRGLDLGLDRLVMGFVYIGVCLSSLAFLGTYAGKEVPGPFGDMIFRAFDQNALKAMAAAVFLTVWSSDTFAYVFGKMIGGKKMAPKISPKKTWAGLCGSMLGAGGMLLLAFIGINHYFDMAMPPLYAVLCFGAFLGIVGQCGDILISYFKRDYDLKDTGALIPGHGGILDRIDALLLVAPFCYGAFLLTF